MKATSCLKELRSKGKLKENNLSRKSNKRKILHKRLNLLPRININRPKELTAKKGGNSKG